MLRPRIIPCLLIHNNGLVKTINFKSPSYIGDPINAVKIFNEKEVDELIVSDIDASIQSIEPNFDLIRKFAEESRMPICYSGGVKTVEHVSKIIKLGIEKVGISSGIFSDINLIKNASDLVGSQSIVAILDIKKNFFGNFSIYINNGTKEIKRDISEVISELHESGVGEIVINSINKDGTKTGYDFDLIDKFINEINTPLTILGGAGSFQDLKSAAIRYGILGLSAGSKFVYQGKYNAVLINFITREEINEIATAAIHRSVG